MSAKKTKYLCTWIHVNERGLKICIFFKVDSLILTMKNLRFSLKLLLTQYLFLKGTFFQKYPHGKVCLFTENRTMHFLYSKINSDFAQIYKIEVLKVMQQESIH